MDAVLEVEGGKQIAQAGLLARLEDQRSHPIVMPAVQEIVQRPVAHRQDQLVRQFVTDKVDNLLDTEDAFLVHVIVLVEDHHDAGKRVDASLACQLILMSSIDRREDDSESFQRVDHLLERGSRPHAREAPVGVEHDDVRRVLALGHDVGVVILCGDRQFVEQADVLLMEMSAVAEEILELIRRKAAVTGVVGTLPVVILVCYPMRIEGFPSLGVRQQLVRLLNLDKLRLGLGMIRFVGMPVMESGHRAIIDNFPRFDFPRIFHANSPFLGQLLVSLLDLRQARLLINSKDLVRIVQARNLENKTSNQPKAKKKPKIHLVRRKTFTFRVLTHQAERL